MSWIKKAIKKATRSVKKRVDDETRAFRSDSGKYKIKELSPAEAAEAKRVEEKQARIEASRAAAQAAAQAAEQYRLQREAEEKEAARLAAEKASAIAQANASAASSGVKASGGDIPDFYGDGELAKRRRQRLAASVGRSGQGEQTFGGESYLG